MADLTSFKLVAQDVIVLGTDGLFENLDQEKIIDIIATLKVTGHFLDCKFML